MHPTYTNHQYYPQGQQHHVHHHNIMPNFQHNTGPLYCIGSYAYPVVNHISTNIIVNQTPFYRTFASVVGCDNPNFDPTQNQQNQFKADNTTTSLDNSCNTNNNSGILNSFIKRLVKQPSMPQNLSSSKQQQQPQRQQPQNSYPKYNQKEFEDFTKMPTVIQKVPYNSSSTTNSVSNLHSIHQQNNFEIPYMNKQGYYKQHTAAPPPPPLSQPSQQRSNFFHTIMGNWYQPQHQYHHSKYNQHQQFQKPNNSNNNNQRWYQKGFKGFRCNRNNNNSMNANKHQQNRPQTRFHHHDAKNVHEKERNSIERDIKNDFCDMKRGGRCNNNNNRKSWNNSKTTSNLSTNSTNNQCDNSEKNPPFEIFSFEEFPAISSTTLLSATSKTPTKKPHVDHEIDDHDFVRYQDDAAATTPSYTPSWPPKRMSLCEKVSKIVKSPQKLLTLPTLATPKRSCLKPTSYRNRSMSESSDDFIVFEYSCDDNNDNDGEDDDDDDSDIDCDEDSDNDDESDMSDDDDDDETMIDNVDEVDEGLKGDEMIQCDQQPDSGIEEKKVRFNTKPTIHVMYAWDHAYRQARLGTCWRQAAVDRKRFKERISNIENVLKHILHRDHRAKVYNERFREEN